VQVVHQLHSPAAPPEVDRGRIECPKPHLLGVRDAAERDRETFRIEANRLLELAPSKVELTELLHAVERYNTPIPLVQPLPPGTAESARFEAASRLEAVLAPLEHHTTSIVERLAAPLDGLGIEPYQPNAEHQPGGRHDLPRRVRSLIAQLDWLAGLEAALATPSDSCRRSPEERISTISRWQQRAVWPIAMGPLGPKLLVATDLPRAISSALRLDALSGARLSLQPPEWHNLSTASVSRRVSELEAERKRQLTEYRSRATDLCADPSMTGEWSEHALRILLHGAPIYIRGRPIYTEFETDSLMDRIKNRSGSPAPSPKDRNTAIRFLTEKSIVIPMENRKGFRFSTEAIPGQIRELHARYAECLSIPIGTYQTSGPFATMIEGLLASPLPSKQVRALGDLLGEIVEMFKNFHFELYEPEAVISDLENFPEIAAVARQGEACAARSHFFQTALNEGVFPHECEQQKLLYRPGTGCTPRTRKAEIVTRLELLVRALPKRLRDDAATLKKTLDEIEKQLSSTPLRDLVIGCIAHLKTTGNETGPFWILRNLGHGYPHSRIAIEQLAAACSYYRKSSLGALDDD
jgi:hypothetical protein